MDTFILCDADSRQKYIKIKTIYLGVTASATTVESSLFNDVQTHSITMQQDVNEEHLKHFFENADIVFLVADLEEDFVVKNILILTEILSKYKKLFTTILANIDPKEAYISMILKEVRQKSSLLIIDNQYDIHINIKEKFTRIISGLYDLIDEEIQEIRVLDDFSSSLITMNRFFDQKCELYLYPNYSRKEFDKIPKIKTLLEGLSQIWIRFTFDQEHNMEASNFVEFIESTIDEDAPCYLSYKTSTNKNIDEVEFTVLISVSNSDTLRLHEVVYFNKIDLDKML